MHITGVRLKNWMAFRGDQRVELPPLPIALVGRHDGDPRRSNWAGKTAFLEAIEWCLSGTHRKRTEDALIHYGEKLVEVELTFDDLMVVSRSRPAGGPSKLVVETCSPIGDTYSGDAAVEFLGRALAMSYEDRAATVNFGQSDVEAIVGMRAGDRRRVVNRWLEIDVWDRAAKVARDRARDALTRVDTLRATIAAIPTPSMTPEQIAKERRDIRTRAGDLEEIAEAARDAERELAEHRRRTNVEEIERQMASVAEQGRLAKERLDLLGHNSPALEAEQREDMQERERGYAVQLGEAERRVRELGSIRERGFGGTCPVMDAPCPARTVVSSSVSQRAHLIDEAVARRNELVTLHRNAKEALAALGREAQARAETRGRYEALKQQYVDLRKRRDAARAEVGKVDVVKLEREIEEGRAARDELAEMAGRLRFLDHLDQEIARNGAARLGHEAELQGAERRARIATIVAGAFGPRGIPQRIASTQLGQLEERANALLQGTGLSFTIGWERETKDPAPVCSDCGHAFKGKREKECPRCGAARGAKMADDLEFLVDDGSGELEDVRTKSGGARVLVASAIRLGGGMMLRELRGSPVAWAIVDEPFGALDVENKETLARTFASMLSSVGLEQAFVVSHDYALLEAMPARLVVNRVDGASTISVEV